MAIEDASLQPRATVRCPGILRSLALIVAVCGMSGEAMQKVFAQESDSAHSSSETQFNEELLAVLEEKGLLKSWEEVLLKLRECSVVSSDSSDQTFETAISQLDNEQMQRAFADMRKDNDIPFNDSFQVNLHINSYIYSNVRVCGRQLSLQLHFVGDHHCKGLVSPGNKIVDFWDDTSVTLTPVKSIHTVPMRVCIFDANNKCIHEGTTVNGIILYSLPHGLNYPLRFDIHPCEQLVPVPQGLGKEAEQPPIGLQGIKSVG